MSSPITFDPLPVPDMEALANIPPWAEGQAAKLDANFAAVNSYLGAVGMRGLTRYSYQTADVVNAGNSGGAWINFNPTVFPPITFTVPPCEALVVSVNVRCWIPGYMWVNVRANPSGPGWTGGSLSSTECVGMGSFPNWLRWHAAGSSYITLTSWGLAVGQQITYTPQWASSNSQFGIHSGMFSVAAVG